MPEREEPFTEICEIRAALYGFLANCLIFEPSPDTLRSLKEHASVLEERSVPLLQSEVTWAIQGLARSVTESSSQDLAIDFAGLFLGGRDGMVCPSESSYLEKMLYGQATLQVIDFYGKHGFMKERSFQEPDDHFSLECAFMSLLGWRFVDIAAKEGVDSAVCRNNLEAQSDFHGDHLARWIPAWAKEIQQCAETPFYRAVALLAGTLLETDREFLAK
jgi:putative dimethyl sulfoxide reductase chaperone